MFVVSWSVSVFIVDFQPLSNRSNAKNRARQRKRKTYIQRVSLYPTVHHSPPTTPHHCPWRHYTGNGRHKQADRSQESVWSHGHRAFMCSKLKVEVGFLGNIVWPCHGWWPCSEMGKKGQLEENSCYSSSVAVVSCWAMTGCPGLWVRTRFFDEDLNLKCPSPLPPFCLGQSGDEFSHFVFSFVLVAFVGVLVLL